MLVALDCSMATAKEAVEWGADLMLTHHPVFFRAVKRILPDDPKPPRRISFFATA